MSQKLYRRLSEGPVETADDTSSTKITITDLTCVTTEDNAGKDECELRIWSDNNYQAHRRDMDNGDVWNLGIDLEFTYRVKIQLYDLDNPDFPLYDDHDRLGTVVIRPGQTDGEGVFNEDGADYTIRWVPN